MNWKDFFASAQPVLNGAGLFFGAMVILGLLGWFTFLKLVSPDVFVSVCSLIIGAWIRHICGDSKQGDKQQ